MALIVSRSRVWWAENTNIYWQKCISIPNG